MFVQFVMKIQAFGKKRSVLDYTRAMPTAQQWPETLCVPVDSLALARATEMKTGTVVRRRGSSTLHRLPYLLC